ncbi:MAG: LPS assembly lipoprotein LptE [Opitutales bacterium]
MTNLPRYLFSKIHLWIVLALGASIISGCASYQMGTPGDADGPILDSIYVDWVSNETFEPDQVVPYTQALREVIMESGVFTLAGSPVDADAVLSVSIANFDRQRQANRSDDTGLALIYRNEVTATVSLVANSDGRVFLDEQIISVSGDALASQGLQASEYQQAPVLARMLANKIRDALLGLNW